MKSSEIKQAFFDFFTSHGHSIVQSSSLIPGNDPTLLFTNAGMVQFKETFLGQETRPYTRAVSAQRCVRAGGKHNDLDNVGYTARHHTFFEMLGNFSFGDYFKREAITYAWEFLTVVLRLPVDRLWVTVYQDDDEAANIWINEVGVSPLRLSRCGEKDNFWSMGDTGPCGPCTEIFYDHGPEIAGGPPGTAEADGDRYIEIWNLVFMQFNRDKNGVLHPLPKPSVDTGMGFERIAAVVQGVHNNYHIDLFQHIIRDIQALGTNIDSEHPSLKVIADHIRSCAFLVSDGITPGNEGRGYVLRRIIRRAVRHGHALNLPMPFFYRLVQSLVEVMGDDYPELLEKQQYIESILLQEEQQFARTLDQGLRLLKEQIAHLDKSIIPGDVAFKLYDTYGFPLDLTADIAREQGLEVDTEGFNQYMQQQRAQSQASSSFQADYKSPIPTDISTSFQGYEHDNFTSQVTALFTNDKQITKLHAGDKAVVVLKDTPFYAESGGQVGDQGFLHGDKWKFRVDNTQKQGNVIIHLGELTEGELSVNNPVEALVNVERRDAIRLNHTATHLLHAALKNVVGSHVQQKGSLVDADRARFDFSHNSPLTVTDILRLESIVNEQIRANYSVDTTIMSIDEAKLSGAVALFGEKYSDFVRVLSIDTVSKELCGGTHARRTGDIGLFKITAEYGVASGVRRIELVTGAYALSFVQEQLSQLQEIASKLKTQPDKIIDKLSQQLQTIKLKDKELAQLQQKLATQSGQELAVDSQSFGDKILLIKRVDHLDAQGLRAMLDQLKSSMERAVIILYSISNDNMNVVAGVSKSILNEVPKARDLVKKLCGRGGGRDDMAQGGGPVPDDLDAKIAEIKLDFGHL